MARARVRRGVGLLDVALAAVVIPMIALALLRVGPLVSAPLRMAFKAAALALPVVALLVVLWRLRRR